MMILADTNILTALAKRNIPINVVVRNALAKLRHTGDDVCLIPQNLIEFASASVATRPVAVNGLGLNFSEAANEIKKFKRYFFILDDVPNIFANWEILHLKYQIVGKNVHDARLVAAMLEHGVKHVLTFNGKDFKRFDEITVLDPVAI